jgi:hypothetical protein
MWKMVPLYEKWQALKKFFYTRSVVLRPQFGAEIIATDFDSRQIMGPWKFNAFQSAIASAPALVVIGLIHLLFETNDEDVQRRVASGTKEALSAFVVPFSLMLAVLIIRRACLDTDDQILETRRRAAKLYLYYDGALGLYSQMLAALAYALWTKIDGISIVTVESQQMLAGMLYTLFIAFWIWQLLVSIRSVPRRIFAALGYAPDIEEVTNGSRQAPWLKYRGAILVAVPLLVGGVGILVRVGATLVSEVAIWIINRARP